MTEAYNRAAWDRQVDEGNMWTRPVDGACVEAARQGDWSVVLIGQTATPRSWFPESLSGIDLLCLASGGGQQGPVLAAAGARVTVFDNSPAQLRQDAGVSAEHDLGIRTVLGDMADLAALESESFDLVFHPVSNVFVPDVRPVWREAFRVLRSGGSLLAGFMNPASFMFDWELLDRTGDLSVRYALPMAEDRDLPSEQLAAIRERGVPLCFSHSLEHQIGAQLSAGFVMTAFEEAHRGADEEKTRLDEIMPTYIATRAVKPGAG